MPLIEVESWIAAPCKEVYSVICRMEDYPVFMKNLERVTVLERGENTTTTEWVANLAGIRLTWTERDCFDESNGRIAYQQIKGDLSRFDGAWKLSPENGGTKIRLSVHVELDIPMFSAMIDPLLKKKVQENSRDMLQSIGERFSSSAQCSE